MRKGDLWIVHIPGLGGHTQQGTRRALVVAAPKLPVVIVMPCTSNLQALRFPHTLRIAASKQNGLTTPSVALAFQLLAIDRRFVQQKIGTLEKPLLAKVDAELQALLAL
jgi:mRNA-degrading endonuclease toxin of MazEF toxin-antitoxin module